MKNNLFLFCPFSTLEPFIRSKFGNEVFFLTAPAGFFRFQEEQYLREVRHFIAHNRPEQIYFVYDTSCRFLNGIVGGQEQPEIPVCEPIRALYHHNFQQIMRAPTMEKKVEKLAEFCMVQQTIHLLQPHILGNEITKYGIQVKGIITNRLKDDYTEVDMNQLLD